MLRPNAPKCEDRSVEADNSEPNILVWHSGDELLQSSVDFRRKSSNWLAQNSGRSFNLLGSLLQQFKHF